MSAAPSPRVPRPQNSWLPGSVLALGLASIITMLVSDYFRHRTILRNEAYLQAACELRVEVALAHLWLEEYVTGDETSHDAIEHTRLAREIAAALLDGNPTDPSDTDPEPLTAPLLREQVAALAGQLETFETVSRNRKLGHEGGLDVGIGSEVDRHYDDVFERVFERAGILEHALAEQMERDKQRSRRVFTGILALWGVLTLAAAFGLRSREQRRLAAETALRASEAQLQQSQKMDALGRLAGGIAHDINNYLAAIRAHCELVQMRLPEDDPIARKMATTVAIIGKAAGLIERLLAFGRRQPIEPQVVDLNSVVRGLEKVMQPSIGEKIRLETRLAPELWSVEADPAQLEQVIVNLLVNARDAMPRGGTITIETSNQPAGAQGEQVLLKVRDTGHGIPSEARDQIFEPFWTTKEEGSGNGLGLAIVYRIVTQSGGTIEVASEPGAGTEFTLRLPRSRKS